MEPPQATHTDPLAASLLAAFAGPDVSPDGMSARISFAVKHLLGGATIVERFDSHAAALARSLEVDTLELATLVELLDRTGEVIWRWELVADA